MQIQKYERGANRLSASKLFEAAKALEAPISAFFDGLDLTGSEAPNLLSELASDDLTVDLVLAFRRILDGPIRQAVVDLAQALSTKT